MNHPIAPNEKQIGGSHYKNGKIQPWDLTRCMETSGSPHVDGCRFAIIKYAFRKKGDSHKMIEDLRKAAHYAEEAAAALEAIEAAKNQPELPGVNVPEVPGFKQCCFACRGPLVLGEFVHAPTCPAK